MQPTTEGEHKMSRKPLLAVPQTPAHARAIEALRAQEDVLQEIDNLIDALECIALECIADGLQDEKMLYGGLNGIANNLRLHLDKAFQHRSEAKDSLAKEAV
jgi:hypothetical protein